jgi:hypothetical protein
MSADGRQDLEEKGALVMSLWTHAHASDRESLFTAEARVAVIRTGPLSRQVHTARTPSAAAAPVPLRMSCRTGAARRPTTQAWREADAQHDHPGPPVGRSRPSGGIVEPKDLR